MHTGLERIRADSRLSAALGILEPHSFFNSGDGPLLQLDIHLSPRFATQWLEARRMRSDPLGA